MRQRRNVLHGIEIDQRLDHVVRMLIRNGSIFGRADRIIEPMTQMNNLTGIGESRFQNCAVQQMRRNGKRFRFNCAAAAVG